MRTEENIKLQRKPLSSLAIEKMKPADKDKSDTGENSGLRVSCGAQGVKTFFYRYTSPLNGKLKQIKIGNFPVMTLAMARQELTKLKALRKSGRCPSSEVLQSKAEKQEAIRQELQEKNFTVEQLVELYLTQFIEDRKINGKKISGARNLKGQSEVRRTLYNDPVRVLGKKTASQVNRKDVINLVMEIVNRGSNVQAGNVLREFSAAFEFSIGLGYFDDSFANPALLAKSSLSQTGIRLTSQRGKRNLSEQELLKLLLWLPQSAYTLTQKNVIRLALWTGCRTGEICAAKWSDFDLEKGTWHLKATKTDVERFVQLSTQAVAFLKQLTLVTGDYLFASSKTGKPIQQKTLTEQAWHMRKNGKALDIENWTPHDLRRTVRTGLSKLGCRNEVAEAVLGHSRKGIEGTYDLHQYESECKAWLQKWADYMDKLVENSE